jgi:hypothetical protein
MWFRSKYLKSPGAGHRGLGEPQRAQDRASQNFSAANDRAKNSTEINTGSSQDLAERVGFEPTSPLLAGYPLSRRALSTAQTPLRGAVSFKISRAPEGQQLDAAFGDQ